MSNLRLKILATTVSMIFLGLVGLVAGIYSGEAELPQESSAISFDEQAADLGIKAGSPLRPLGDAKQSVTAACDNPQKLAASAAAVLSYSPRQGRALAHPTNYGERMTKDIYGRPVNNQLLVVLHETVASAASTIRFFQTPHDKDDDQASYHALVTRDGTIVYFVSPEKRAFGAGNSVFNGSNGPETVKTDPKLPPSVNNFAYHISLETPANGNHNRSSHSGYTEAQYQSLAWLVARTRVPDQRITTHKAVDRSGDRQDPRSFNSQKFLGILHSYPRPNEVAAQC
jgi:hypothetical protein